MLAGLTRSLAALSMIGGRLNAPSADPGNRIAIGHPIYARKGAGHHNKRRAKKYARTMGHNLTQRRRR